MRKAVIASLGTLIALACGLQAQNVQDTRLTDCPAAHLRFTARRNDGSPAAGLRPSDVRVWFGGAVVQALSLKNGVASKDAVTDTDILFVVPPFFRLNRYSIASLIARIRSADNFHIVAAVLAPDGAVSGFSDDPEKLDSELGHAISTHLRHSSWRMWPGHEAAAFVKLGDLPGRHVIIDLQDPANPFRSPVKSSFIADRTMERLALFDGSQVYGLVNSVPSDALIPSGDASTIHSDIGPENHGAEQLQQVQRASREQSNLWAEKNAMNNLTGGRKDETLDEIFQEVLNDAAGSYDAVALPVRDCIAGRVYSVNVTSTVVGVRVFGPNAVQMIPVKELAH